MRSPLQAVRTVKGKQNEPQTQNLDIYPKAQASLYPILPMELNFPATNSFVELTRLQFNL